MKTRLKIDGMIIAFLSFFTVGIYFFPQLFVGQAYVRDAFYFLALFMILKGMFIRMSARGHKKTLSPQGQGLAKSGLYAYTRNPMYLGSFMCGLGFALILWPWWALPIFAYLFYLRFQPQVQFEEGYLKKTFGKLYEDYCREVPQVFPSIKAISHIHKREECPWHELWLTKEKYGFFFLPILANILKVLSGWMLYRTWSCKSDFVIFVLAVGIFAFVLFYEYQLKHEKNTK